ncbi:hypothetical protein ABK040_000007 [Willaertia magna]
MSNDSSSPTLSPKEIIAVENNNNGMTTINHVDKLDGSSSSLDDKSSTSSASNVANGTNNSDQNNEDDDDWKPITNLVQYFSDENNRKQIDSVLHCLSKLEEHNEKSKTVEHNGTFQFLCNILYELDKDDLEFYMLQLLNTYMIKANERESHLERFILELCANSMHFGIKISWLLDAELYTLENQLIQTPNNIKLKKRVQRGMIFRNLVEKVTINQKVPVNYMNDNFLSAPMLTSDSPAICDSYNMSFIMNNNSSPLEEDSEMMKQLNNNNLKKDPLENVFLKQRRSNYFNDEHYFVHALTDLSYRLKAYPAGDLRKYRMKAELERLNETIPYGVYYPLCDSNDYHYRILRICTDACRVFSTKERVPYLCIFEVAKDDFKCNRPDKLFEMDEKVLNHFVVDEFKKDESSCSIGSNSGRVNNGNLNNGLHFEGNNGFNEFDDVESVSSSNGGEVSENGDQNTGVSSVLSDCSGMQTKPTHAFGNQPPLIDTSVVFIPGMKMDQVEQVASKIIESSLTPSANDDDFIIIDKKNAITKQEIEIEKQLECVFGESWSKTKERYRLESPYGSMPGWDLKTAIVKANDDIRQEIFAMQLIKLFKQIFEEEKVPIYLRPYEIIVTSGNCGMLETVRDTVSFDGLKKKFPNFTTLKDYFTKVYGDPLSMPYIKAQTNFVESAVGYSIISYILQIKDRHNGNILIDREGHIVHIDFGFFLGISPGGVNFEVSPFKLPQEWVDLMGELFDLHFRPVFFVAFSVLRKKRNMNRIINLVEMMMGANYKCFDNNHASSLKELKGRFYADLSEEEFAKVARKLVDDSIDNWFSKKYDQYQYLTNGIKA